ncbi:odorant receptor 131-2-like [Scomber japonicus]|uniref:odorant receptor 131-2-like n=1 Tax=Scomber japonicus TaxID=13676 RepID=UPI002304E741|nr:odorant receptor 131-2-like [Scomber japonicus]
MNNATEVIQVIPFQKAVRALLSMLPCVFFLYINGVMLFALLKKPLLLETSRYVLFGHLLFTESVQLLVTMLLYLFAFTMVRMVSYVCVTVSLLAGITVKMSPLNLAVMSLERYVAICFPLRHVDIVTTRKTSIAIAVMWTVASLDSLTQMFLFISLESTGFTLQTFCTKKSVFRLKIFTTVNNAFTIVYFVLVGMIIIYTYIAIMFAVKSASGNVRNASRACRTVLLHLLQLCLCLTSTLFNIINSNNMLPPHIQYAFFLGLIVLPKCLSPLIYGLREHALRHVLKYYFTFGIKTTIRPYPKS